jgi:hypothetical protein
VTEEKCCEESLAFLNDLQKTVFLNWEGTSKPVAAEVTRLITQVDFSE